MADLFDSVEPGAAGGKPAPLADRLRPATFSEVIGQQHLLATDGRLSRGDGGMQQWLSSIKFIWTGPPGVGTTTSPEFVALSHRYPRWRSIAHPICAALLLAAVCGFKEGV